MKIAFCFLIYNTIHHEDLWHLFFEHVDPSLYSIYVHYKLNEPLRHFESYKLPYCVETKYSETSIVHAQNIMLERALRDEKNHHFVFLSATCIPLKPFRYIYHHLDPSVSYFNICPISQCFPRCDSLLSYMPREHIQKASQWCILNRAHGELALRNMVYLHWYRDVYGPDEIFYITTIFRHGLEGELYTTPNVAAGATTFTNWQGMDYLYPCDKGLKAYSSVSNEELMYLCHSTSLFGRKFNQECSHSLLNQKYRAWISYE